MTDKKDPYDTTSSRRQAAHLERLAATKGKRKVLDLDGEDVAKLDALRDGGYGKDDRAVLRRALDDAYSKFRKKKS